MRRFPRLLLIAAAATCAGAALGQTLYKWVDANGVVHYTQQPPPHGKASKFDLRSGKSESEHEAKPASASSSSFAADDKAFRSSACQSARQDLAVLASGKMVVSGGTLAQPGGVEDARKLTPEQREAARAEASKRVHDYCGQG